MTKKKVSSKHSRVAGALLLACLLATGAQAKDDATAPVDLSPVAAKDPGSKLAASWTHGAFMEIFVRAYQDSDGDGIGDLRGLTRRLDYLKALGVKGIWLMPVMTSADHDHGYATTDYRGIEPAYGNLADFDELLKQAHARGIGIIVDYVINHSARSHPLFASSESGPASPYRDWYVWQDQDPGGWDIWGKNPWTTTPQGAYFATFGPHIPDFNLRNPRVVAYHEDSLRFWLNRGVDGFRLDAVPHMIENGPKDWNDQPESRALTGELRKLITGYARHYVVCEATANPQAYAAPEVCGSAFAFGGHGSDIVEAAKGKPEAIRAVADYFKTAPASMATMVSNHDIFAGQRLWDQVGGDVAQYKLAAATYLLQPGTPFIYYGEEIGMGGVNSLPGDEPLRSPMSWSADANSGFTSGQPFRPAAPNAATHNAAAEQADPHSLLAFYKDMLKLRNTLPSIAQGSYEGAQVEGQTLSYQRKLKRERSVVLLNYGTEPAELTVPGLHAGARLKSAYPRGWKSLKADRQGVMRVRMPAQSVRVLVVQR